MHVDGVFLVNILKLFSVDPVRLLRYKKKFPRTSSQKDEVILRCSFTKCLSMV